MIGDTIKSVAKFLCWVGIIGSVIIAIIMFSEKSHAYGDEETMYAIRGFVWLIVGPLVSCISSLLMFGFGKLIENTTIIMNNTALIIEDHKDKKDLTKEKTDTLEKLFKDGLITEKEYMEKNEKYR